MPGRLEADSHKRELVMDLYIVQYCKRSHQNKGQETNKQKQPKTNHKQQTREKWDSYQLLAIMRTMTSCVPSYSMAIKQKTEANKNTRTKKGHTVG
jgi:cytosine/uracil/thiamine/allantoin permease